MAVLKKLFRLWLFSRREQFVQFVVTPSWKAFCGMSGFGKHPNPEEEDHKDEYSLQGDTS